MYFFKDLVKDRKFVKRLRDGYRSRKTLVQLSAELGPSTALLARVLRELGEPVRPRGVPAEGRVGERDAALRRTGLTLREIGARRGITRQGVLRGLRRAGK